jgi:hypothetical protein
MNQLEAALLEVATALDDLRVPYMVIGGFANLRWGKPRLTQDIDFKVELDESRWGDALAMLSRRFRILVDEPIGFLRETRVLPVATRNGVRADLVVAGLPYESEAIRRAIAVRVAARDVRLCTAEDLVLHKVLSDRPRDREDVEGIVLTQRERIDRAYLDPRVHAIAAGLERPEIEEFYRECLRRAGLEPPLNG